MSVAWLKYDPVLSLDTPAETKSGSYIYSGSAASFHDWEFRTRARVFQHREKQRSEVLKDLRASHQLSHSASPRKWVGGGLRSSDRHTSDESSGAAASPSSASGRRRVRQTEAQSTSSRDGDEDEQQSQDPNAEDDDEASVATEPVPTLASVRDSDLDMTDAVQKTLEGLRGDAFLVARDIGLERLLQHDCIEFLIQKVKEHAFPLQGEEASELFRQGQLLTGPLSKQAGEPMLSHISRRKHWWTTLRELDLEVRLSEATRANLPEDEVFVVSKVVSLPHPAASLPRPPVQPIQVDVVVMHWRPQTFNLTWRFMGGYRERKHRVLSFSHFLPRLELMPEKRFLFTPNLTQIVGSDFIRHRVDMLQPDLHIFGHSHFPWDATLGDGVRYKSWPLGTPAEQARLGLNALADGPNYHNPGYPLPVFDSLGRQYPTNAACWYSLMYTRIKRDPKSYEMAGFVADIFCPKAPVVPASIISPGYSIPITDEDGAHMGGCQNYGYEGKSNASMRREIKNWSQDGLRPPAPLHTAAASGSAQAVEALLHHKATVTATEAHGVMALHLAADRGSSKVVELLLEAKAPLAAKDLNQQTVLHFAARSGNCDTLSILLQRWLADESVSSQGARVYGGAIDWRDRWHRTPLHWAVLNGHTAACEVLLNARGSPEPPKVRAYRHEKSTSLLSESPLEIAQRRGDDELVPQSDSAFLPRAVS
eukprot:s5069_g2.t2